MRNARPHPRLSPTRTAGRGLLALLLSATLAVGSIGAASADDLRADQGAIAPAQTDAETAAQTAADQDRPEAQEAQDGQAVPAQEAQWSVGLSAEPAPGTEVEPGDEITYTLTVSALDRPSRPGIEAGLDLSQVLEHAEVTSDLPAEAGLVAGELVWSPRGAVAPNRPISMSVTVQVGAEAAGATLPATASPRTDAGTCTTCATTHTVATPSWELSVDANPESGSALLTNGQVSYQLHATNTGSVPVTGAMATADLSGVLQDADITRLGDGMSQDGDTVLWEIPDLGPGESVTAAVHVRVHTYISRGADLVATFTTDGRWGECTDSCEMAHHVVAFDVTVSSDPDSGEVRRGDEITYTWRVENTSSAVVSGAHVQTAQRGFLDHAELQQPLAEQLRLIGTAVLRWDLPDLAPGEVLENQFSVIVDADAEPGAQVVTNPSTGTARHGGSVLDPGATSHTVAVPEPTWTLSASADPESGATVEPGDVLTYTMTAEAIGPRPATGVVATADLSEVLQHAELLEPLAPGLELDGDELVWTQRHPVPLQRPASVTYSVVVDEDAWGQDLNQSISPGPETGTCAEEACTTIHHTPAWELDKTATPESGATIVPGPTGVITYSLTATNTSRAVVSGATAVDDLTEVVAYADLQPLADDLAFDAQAQSLTWSVPELEPGESATVTYRARVLGAAAGQTLVNAVSAEGAGGQCQQECSTTHHIPQWEASITADPGNGAQVMPGDTVTYTLSAQNTGDGTVSGARLQNQLSSVLGHAELVEPLDPTLSVLGNYVFWNVPDLGPRDAAEVSFEVTVNADAWGADFTNRIVTAPQQLGGFCDADCSASHTVGMPTWTLSQSADPASGTSVVPGEMITYTMTAEAAGLRPATGVAAVADLSEVLEHADLVEPLPPGVTRAGDQLVWEVRGPVPGNRPASVSYSVVVDDAWGQTLTSALTPGTGGVCADDGCVATHPLPAWTVAKSADPASGASLRPGMLVTYSMTVTNESQAPVSGAQVRDDVSEVEPYGTLQRFADDGLVYDGQAQIITWSVPDLEPGQSATVSYAFRSLTEAAGHTLVNTSEPAGPDGWCLDNCTLTHPVSAWTADTSAEPASGQEVLPGEQITYTLTAVNTSDAVVSLGQVHDNLADVLAHAELSAPLAEDLDLNGQRLTWNVPELEPGERAQVSYAVQVEDGAWDVTLENRISFNQLGTSCTDCATAVHTPVAAPWSATFSAWPADTATVRPNAAVAFNVGAANGSHHLTGAQAQVDFSDLPATVQTDSLPAEFHYDADSEVLTWHVPELGPRQLLPQRTFHVRIDDGAWGQEIHTQLSPGPGGECVSSCSLVHYTPAWELSATADPASGAEVLPGEQITYTLTAVNTSQVPTRNAVARADLADLLVHGELAGPLPDGVSLDTGTGQLSWAVGALEPGSSSTISYTVTLDSGAHGAELSARLSAVGSGGECTGGCDSTYTVAASTAAPSVIEQVFRLLHQIIRGLLFGWL